MDEFNMRRIKLTRPDSNNDLNREIGGYNRTNTGDVDEKFIKKSKGGRPKKNQDDRKSQKAYTYLTQKDKDDYYKYCNEHLRIDVAEDLRKYILETLDKARSEGII